MPWSGLIRDVLLRNMCTIRLFVGAVLGLRSLFVVSEVPIGLRFGVSFVQNPMRLQTRILISISIRMKRTPAVPVSATATAHHPPQMSWQINPQTCIKLHVHATKTWFEKPAAPTDQAPSSSADAERRESTNNAYSTRAKSGIATTFTGQTPISPGVHVTRGQFCAFPKRTRRVGGGSIFVQGGGIRLVVVGIFSGRRERMWIVMDIY